MTLPEELFAAPTQGPGLSQTGTNGANLELRFRPALETDLPFLFQLYASTRPDILSLPWSDEQKTGFLLHQINAQRTDYQRRYPGGAHSIIEKHGAGNITALGRFWVAQTPSEIRLVDIILAPQHCGQGFGTALIRDLITIASERHLQLRHAVDSSNLAALRLYERLGFRVKEDVGTHLFMSYEPLT